MWAKNCSFHSFLLVFSSPQKVSSYPCANQDSAEDLGGSLCCSLEQFPSVYSCSLFSRLYVLWHDPLWMPVSLAFLSYELRASSGLHSGSLQTTSWVTDDAAPTRFLLPGITVLGYLLSNAYKPLFHIFCLVLYLFQVRKGNQSLLCHDAWKCNSWLFKFEGTEYPWD